MTIERETIRTLFCGGCYHYEVGGSGACDECGIYQHCDLNLSLAQDCLWWAAEQKCEFHKPICSSECGHGKHPTDLRCYRLDDAYMAGCEDYKPTTCGHCPPCRARAQLESEEK